MVRVSPRAPDAQEPGWAESRKEALAQHDPPVRFQGLRTGHRERCTHLYRMASSRSDRLLRVEPVERVEPDARRLVALVLHIAEQHSNSLGDIVRGAGENGDNAGTGAPVSKARQGTRQP